MFSQKIFLKILQNSQKNIFAGFSFLTKLQAGNLKLAEAATGDLESLLESLFNKVEVLRACNFIKEDSDTCFFCEIYKLFKDNYFEEHL